MDEYSQLRLEAMQKAAVLLDSIIQASRDPSKQIKGEALVIYNEFVDWNWLEHYPIAEEKNRWLYLTIIAQTQYRHLKWQHDHPQPKKATLSKWEKVAGRAGRR